MTEYEKYQVKRAKHLLDSLGMSTGNNVTKDIESDLICVHLAKTYVKLNMIDKSLDLLYNFKASTYYGQKYKDYAYIDYMISDLENKKSKGYIYRPRKKHQNKIKSDTNQIKDKVNETIPKIDKKKKSDIDTSYISNIVNEELERLKRNGIIEETDID